MEQRVVDAPVPLGDGFEVEPDEHDHKDALQVAGAAFGEPANPVSDRAVAASIALTADGGVVAVASTATME